MRPTSKALALALCLVGCGARKPLAADGGEVLRAPGLRGVHLSSCADPGCGNGANPPLGGDHCPTALACRVYDTAQPRCQWVHNLEHGHAVLAYNCPGGCPDLVTQLNGIFAAHAGRLLVTPDPLLPRRVAALVWGFGWQGDVLNPSAVDAVLSHQDEEAPEPMLGCAP